MNSDQPHSLNSEASDSKPRSRWKNVILAGFLSLLVPGTGQLYNRQPRKAFALASITYLFFLLTIKTRLVFAFWTMLATFLTAVSWRLFVAIEAGYAAASAKAESTVPMPRLTYPLLAAIFVAAAWLTGGDQLKSEAGFAAFKIPSASMCPTICMGERIVADMHAFKSRPLQRGDLILLKHPSSEGLFVKRVIAVPGDTVAPGASGSIRVNGNAFNPPAPCGLPIWEKKDSADYSTFPSISVPTGSVFVVGDNLSNSFDSRVPEFGAVSTDMVRGKPLFLYWSPSTSRIGCSVR